MKLHFFFFFQNKFRSTVLTQLSLADICSGSSSDYKLRVGT